MPSRRLASLLIAAVAAAALTVGCSRPTTTQSAEGAMPSGIEATAAPQASSVATQGAKGTIVYDFAHGEIFGPEDGSDLGQSKAVSKMQSAGYGVDINRDPVTDKTLKNASALYVAGPMRAFTTAEQEALDRYLTSGGTVVLTVHVPYPIIALPTRWGLPLGTAVVMSPKGFPQDKGVFVVSGINKDPLTEGVKNIAIFSGWSVSADKNRLETAKIAVQTGPEALVDSNGDQQYSDADQHGPFGVVGVTTVGSGRVIVVVDDAIFANMGIGMLDNGVLFDNILKLVNAPKGA